VIITVHAIIQEESEVRVEGSGTRDQRS